MDFPLFRRQLLENINAYKSSFCSPSHRVGFSMKANHSPEILRVILDQGLSVVAVSGCEVMLALKLGFTGDKIFYNGVGKQPWEVGVAVQSGCYLNVDSIFDAKLICNISREKDKTVQVEI